MTMLSKSTNAAIASWRRLLGWLQAFDNALNHDPVDRTVGDLNRKVPELEKAVSDLKVPQPAEPKTNSH